MNCPAFCALGSLYDGEKSENFRQAMQSLFMQSYMVPVILVVDGPIRKELRTVVDEYKGKIHKIVELTENIGLGPALNAGIESLAGEFDFIIRYDTDDINEPNRFEVLIRSIKEWDVDIIGSFITEFYDGDLAKTQVVRRVPKSAESIAHSIHVRNPFNHPAVAFRITKFESVCGYEDVPGFEDWYLWAKMLKSDAKALNLAASLVRFRGGQDMLDRRRGWRYVKREFSFFLLLYKLKLSGRWIIPVILPARLLIRFMPSYFLSQLYSKLLRSK
ncbi:glycosyltransferase [Alphaproteobacteria bacterium]|nr:glycosyltransferase [Alphaproteobacteria bacterium]